MVLTLGRKLALLDARAGQKSGYNYMDSLFNLIQDYKIKEVNTFKNFRDEIISLMVEDINKLREGTNFKKETKSNLAKRINMNPFLAGNKNDGELELLYKECHSKQNYSKLYYLLKSK